MTSTLSGGQDEMHPRLTTSTTQTILLCNLSFSHYIISEQSNHPVTINAIPTLPTIRQQARSRCMTLLLLEALGAGLLFIGIIWWTMFSGRDNGELPRSPDTPPAPPGSAEKNTDKSDL